MKHEILNSYKDKVLNRVVKVGEVLDLSDEKIEALKKAGIKTKQVKEDISVLEQYEKDKNIVDSFKADDLKALCKELDIKYTNADEIREHLKNMESLKDK